MINKRLLIKNLLAHNDENTFFDKKRKIDISHKEGKAKFLKHICALSNSNPNNNSYIVIGVEDEDNSIVGVDFLMIVKYKTSSMPISLILQLYNMRTFRFHIYKMTRLLV